MSMSDFVATLNAKLTDKAKKFVTPLLQEVFRIAQCKGPEFAVDEVIKWEEAIRKNPTKAEFYHGLRRTSWGQLG